MSRYTSNALPLLDLLTQIYCTCRNNDQVSASRIAGTLVRRQWHDDGNKVRVDFLARSVVQILVYMQGSIRECLR